jgi:hypothetical protein
MAAGRIIIPNCMPALDINGNPVSGAKLTFYVNETTTLLPVYTTSALNVAHPNPVSADAAGAFPSIFADTAVAYSVAVTDADGVPITGLRNRDNVMASLFYGDDYIDTAALKANNLSDLASASTARTNLGLGTMALQSASAVAITGGSATGLSAIGMAGGTVTADAPLVSGTQTWNNGAVAFTGYKLNVTNTASAATSKLLDLQVGGVGKFTVDYLGVPRIGSYGASSTDGGCILSRDMFDASTTAGHGFVAADYFRRPGTNAYAAFDATVVMAGESYDHWAGFQDRPAYQAGSGAQTMLDMYGFYTKPSIDTGTVVERFGAYVAAPTLTGGGAMTTQYGFYTESLTAGGTNWAVYTAGATPSYFGGAVTLNGGITGQVVTGRGTAGAPAYTFTSDLDVGMWSPSANVLAFSTSGTEAIRVHSTRNVSIGNTTDTDKLSVTGDIRASNRYYGTGTTAYVKLDDSLGSQLTYNTGNLTVAPSMVFLGSGVEKFRVNVGSGDITSTGSIGLLTGTAIPAGGTAGAGIKVSSTSNYGIFFGSGAPTLSAAKGSLYLRSDGSGTNDRMYVNTNGSTTWTAVVTVA